MRRALFIILLLALVGAVFHFAPGAQSDSLSPEEIAGQLVTPAQTTGEEGLSGWQALAARVHQNPFNLVPTILFGLAIIHAFCTGWFRRLGEVLQRRFEAKRAKAGEPIGDGRAVSFGAEICHFLGEVEVVFGLWTIPLVIAISYCFNWHAAVAYLNSRNYTEPLFIVVVMTVASTQPILKLTEQIIGAISKLGGGGPGAWWLSLLTIGPLLGSVITEPGAMTVTALLLSKKFFSRKPSRAFAYATLGLLFVNISTGGDLTNFAAPPVLIVASKWGWTTPFMFTRFGWKSIIGIVVGNLAYYFVFRREFSKLEDPPRAQGPASQPVPLWITLVHLVFLGWIVFASHEMIIFIGAFLIFLAFYQATLPHQQPLNLRSPLLIGLFLTGLVIHGGLQGWWIEPLLSAVAPLPLMLLSVGLTTVNDNAAITYLSSLAPSFTTSQKYAVVAGAVSGGGLTVIANGPNPAGVQILGDHFKHGISHFGLLLGALVPTVIVTLAFILFGLPILAG